MVFPPLLSLCTRLYGIQTSMYQALSSPDNVWPVSNLHHLPNRGHKSLFTAVQWYFSKSICKYNTCSYLFIYYEILATGLTWSWNQQSVVTNAPAGLSTSWIKDTTLIMEINSPGNSTNNSYLAFLFTLKSQGKNTILHVPPIFGPLVAGGHLYPQCHLLPLPERQHTPSNAKLLVKICCVFRQQNKPESFLTTLHCIQLFFIGGLGVRETAIQFNVVCYSIPILYNKSLSFF